MNAASMHNNGSISDRVLRHNAKVAMAWSYLGLLLLASCGKEWNNGASNQAIVNGQASAIEQVVWLTAQKPDGLTAGCSAVIVDDSAVLTAAHCVAAVVSSADGQPACNYRCGPDSHDAQGRPLCNPDGCPLLDFAPFAEIAIEHRGERFASSSVIIHPRRLTSAGHAFFDVAIVKLDRSLATSPLQISHALPQQGQEITLVGFGVTGADMGDLGTRRETQARIADSGGDTGDVIHLHLEAGYGATCGGDSGGPALVKGADGAWQVAAINVGGPSDCVGDGSYAGAFKAAAVYRKLTWLSQHLPALAPAATALGIGIGVHMPPVLLFANHGEPSWVSDACQETRECLFSSAGSVLIKNVGAGELGDLLHSVDYHGDPAWLSLSENYRESPHSGGLSRLVGLSHRADASATPPGLYDATVTLIEGHSAEPLSYPVRLYVLPSGGDRLFSPIDTTVQLTMSENGVSGPVVPLPVTYAFGAKANGRDLAVRVHYPEGWADRHWVRTGRTSSGDLTIHASSSALAPGSTFPVGEHHAEIEIMPLHLPLYRSSHPDVAAKVTTRVPVVLTVTPTEPPLPSY